MVFQGREYLGTLEDMATYRVDHLGCCIQRSKASTALAMDAAILSSEYCSLGQFYKGVTNSVPWAAKIIIRVDIFFFYPRSQANTSMATVDTIFSGDSFSLQMNDYIGS